MSRLRLRLRQRLGPPSRWLGISIAAAMMLPIPAAALEVEARPGSVVRWSGEAIDACGRGEETWDPLDGACWYPIDLLQPEGHVSVHRTRGATRDSGSIRVTAYPYPVQRITLEDGSRVDLSAEDLARVRREQARVRPLWKLRGPALFEFPLADPLDELGEGGSFGSRRFFNDQPRSPHSGADYAAVAGTTVYAAAPGRVALAADLFFSGKSVFIDHGDGLVSMYFHLSDLLVDEGQPIGGREPVGRVGMTGRTTGPHLHFGIRWKGARIDPAQLLGRSDPVPELTQGAR